MYSLPLSESANDSSSESTWTRREQARQRQIAIGKARPEYRRYSTEAPREMRTAGHPTTPDPKERISKRQFDRSLSSWRCRLHEWDMPRFPNEVSRAVEGVEITPLPRRGSHADHDVSTGFCQSEFSDRRIPNLLPSHGEDGGIVNLRLADALPTGSTPMTPQLGIARHCHQFGVQRQLDFGAASKHTIPWQTCSPMDAATPSTMCTLSPTTPAPRTRPMLQSARQQTVFENETPDRPPYWYSRPQLGRCDSPAPKPQRESSPPKTPPTSQVTQMLEWGATPSPSHIYESTRDLNPSWTQRVFPVVPTQLQYSPWY